MLRTWWEGVVRRGGGLVGKRCVQSQFVTEGLFFAAVGEPVVHPDLSNQVGAQACKLGGRHPPLDTLCPEGGRAHSYMALHLHALSLSRVWSPKLLFN